ncbi:YqzE family protein [Alteribacter natronophilus]|uniref:YqzE family protein n=1 Tax=Alteribacter natronophilus TaxID=2583810 RepID=UPI00110DBDFA|nr:YqzE family protein [Alteribacter natronophilus]TMW73775.1 YqzE family protein [Alteribacter natronophilus]
MKTNDYVKFVTQQFVTYAEQPKSERVKRRQEKKEARPPLLHHWFGLLPFALFLFYSKNKQRLARRS